MSLTALLKFSYTAMTIKALQIMRTAFAQSVQIRAKMAKRAVVAKEDK